MNIKHIKDDIGALIWYIDTDKCEFYYSAFMFEINGKLEKLVLHNESGPAFIGSDGHTQYRLYGKLCRFDGPAVVDPSGYVEYHLGEGHLTFDEWFEQLTPEQQIIALYNPDNF